MAAQIMPIGNTRVGYRITIPPGAPVSVGTYLVREITRRDQGKVALVLQPVDGGADVEATFAGDFAVGHTPPEKKAMG